MSHAGHQIIKCSCGAIISQCRCFDPDKPERIEPNGCKTCKAFKPLEIGTSSMLTGMTYNAAEEKLRVTFANRKDPTAKGQTAEYKNVPPELAELFEKESVTPGGSVGKLFVAEIKNKPDLYPFVYV